MQLTNKAVACSVACAISVSFLLCSSSSLHLKIILKQIIYARIRLTISGFTNDAISQPGHFFSGHEGE